MATSYIERTKPSKVNPREISGAVLRKEIPSSIEGLFGLWTSIPMSIRKSESISPLITPVTSILKKQGTVKKEIIVKLIESIKSALEIELNKTTSVVENIESEVSQKVVDSISTNTDKVEVNPVPEQTVTTQTVENESDDISTFDLANETERTAYYDHLQADIDDLRDRTEAVFKRSADGSPLPEFASKGLQSLRVAQAFFKGNFTNQLMRLVVALERNETNPESEFDISKYGKQLGRTSEIISKHMEIVENALRQQAGEQEDVAPSEAVVDTSASELELIIAPTEDKVTPEHLKQKLQEAVEKSGYTPEEKYDLLSRMSDAINRYKHDPEGQKRSLSQMIDRLVRDWEERNKEQLVTVNQLHTEIDTIDFFLGDPRNRPRITPDRYGALQEQKGILVKLRGEIQATDEPNPRETDPVNRATMLGTYTRHAKTAIAQAQEIMASAGQIVDSLDSSSVATIEPLVLTDAMRVASKSERLILTPAQRIINEPVQTDAVVNAMSGETPVPLVAFEHKTPIDIGLEELKDARATYRDALLSAIKMKAMRKNNSAAVEMLAEVEKVKKVYDRQFATMQRAQGRSGSDAEITALEARLQNESSEWRKNIQKISKILALGLGVYVASSEGAGDGTRHDRWDGEAVSGQGSEAMQTPTDIVEGALTANSPEVIPCVVLRPVQIAPQPEAPFSGAADQVPSDPGVTFSYPVNPLVNIPVPSNDWRAAALVEPKVSMNAPELAPAAQPDSAVPAIPPGWGANTPDVQFAMPTEETAVTLSAHDISPKLDLDVPLPSHHFANGEGLWNVVMGTTEIGDVPALVGETYESRREIWRQVTERAKNDAAFRDLLGVRIDENHNDEPRIFENENFNTNFFNEHVKELKQQLQVSVPLPVVEKVVTPTVASIPETIVPQQPVETVSPKAEQAPITAETINQYRENFPGGKQALADALEHFVEHAEGMFHVPEGPKSFLARLSTSHEDPYKALVASGMTAGDILTMSKSRADIEHRLEELKIPRGGLDVWVERIRALDTRYPSLNISKIPFVEVVVLVFIEELLHRQRNAIEL